MPKSSLLKFLYYERANIPRTSWAQVRENKYPLLQYYNEGRLSASQILFPSLAAVQLPDTADLVPINGTVKTYNESGQLIKEVGSNTRAAAASVKVTTYYTYYPDGSLKEASAYAGMLSDSAAPVSTADLMLVDHYYTACSRPLTATLRASRTTPHFMETQIFEVGGKYVRAMWHLHYQIRVFIEHYPPAGAETFLFP